MGLIQKTKDFGSKIISKVKDGRVGYYPSEETRERWKKEKEQLRKERDEFVKTLPKDKLRLLTVH